MSILDSIMRESIDIMIKSSSNEKTIKKFTKKHNNKIHFIPIKYRVFGGIIQSLNIKFGNFIEVAIHQILLQSNNNKIIEEYSGKRSNSFCISVATEKLIDEYITNCEIHTYTDLELKEKYNNLLDQIIINESDKNCPVIKFEHDVDILFIDKKEDITYYVEIKYNDDHDTGKFVDINRKLLKTYSYLVRKLEIYFFTNKRMKGNIYIPEDEVIYRGSKFFEKFTNIRYEELIEYMLNISEEDQTLKQFDNMYNNVINNETYEYNENITIYNIKENNEKYI
ncbi:MAG: hypothetical protein RSF67_08220, partial [Clostridia bacterium]